MCTKIDYSEDINSRYAEMEQQLDRKLEIIKKEEIRFEKQDCSKPTQLTNNETGCNSLEEARKRNNELIKSLEISKARLRSRSTYSPIEIILKKTIQNYKNDNALVPVTNKF